MSAIETRNASYFRHVDSGGVGKQHLLILAKLELAALLGLPDSSLREIAAMTRLQINAVSGRVNELKKLGLLVEGPTRRCTVTGSTITPVKFPENNYKHPLVT